MDPSLVVNLPAVIGAPRFNTYLRHYDGRIDLALRLYAWNIELSSAFLGPISILEVMLRNSIHDVMKQGRQEDWWFTANLMKKESENVQSTVDDLRRKLGRDPSADDVVGATSFGFWVAMTGEGIPRDPMLSYETAIWQPRLQRAFPNRGSIGRKEIHDKLQRIRAFRNRVAHHEAIFRAPIFELRDLISEIACLIDPAVAGYIDSSHRIDEVMARQQVAITTGSCRF